MPDVTVSTDIDRHPSEVWAYLADIASHVEWMADATEIRFSSEQTEGPGTAFECDTRVGPFRLTDLMMITSWEDGTEMGVRHEGLVTGAGRFTLEPIGDGGTRFTWSERLSFPPRLGGPVGEVLATPILTLIWRRNLRRLKRRLETTGP